MSVITYKGLYILSVGGVYNIVSRQGEDVANDLKTELDAYIFIEAMSS